MKKLAIYYYTYVHAIRRVYIKKQRGSNSSGSAVSMACLLSILIFTITTLTPNAGRSQIFHLGIPLGPIAGLVIFLLYFTIPTLLKLFGFEMNIFEIKKAIQISNSVPLSIIILYIATSIILFFSSLATLVIDAQQMR